MKPMKPKESGHNCEPSCQAQEPHGKGLSCCANLRGMHDGRQSLTIFEAGIKESRTNIQDLPLGRQESWEEDGRAPKHAMLMQHDATLTLGSEMI